MKRTTKEGAGELTIANKNGDIDGALLTPEEKNKAFEEAYKKQNLKKYQEKKAAGLFN